eukprot:SAG22_NODE_1494_length_4300_cov_6.567722_3_plen_320_part_00
MLPPHPPVVVGVQLDGPLEPDGQRPDRDGRPVVAAGQHGGGLPQRVDVLVEGGGQRRVALLEAAAVPDRRGGGVGGRRREGPRVGVDDERLVARDVARKDPVGLDRRREPVLDRRVDVATGAVPVTVVRVVQHERAGQVRRELPLEAVLEAAGRDGLRVARQQHLLLVDLLPAVVPDGELALAPVLAVALPLGPLVLPVRQLHPAAPHDHRIGHQRGPDGQVYGAGDHVAWVVDRPVGGDRDVAGALEDLRAGAPGAGREAGRPGAERARRLGRRAEDAVHRDDARRIRRPHPRWFKLPGRLEASTSRAPGPQLRSRVL